MRPWTNRAGVIKGDKMDGDSRKKSDLIKLVDILGEMSLDLPVIMGRGPAPTNQQAQKRITRVTEPHLRPHKVKGKLYYHYCRGTDPEIYLGSADSILKAVKG